MARPRKTLTEKLSDKINVATSPTQKRAAEVAAKSHDISLSCLMNLALVQYLDPEGRIKNRRSYRRAEVVDALGRSATALENLAQIAGCIGPEHGALEVSAGLLRVERLLVAVVQGAGAADGQPDEEEDASAFAGDPE